MCLFIFIATISLAALVMKYIFKLFPGTHSKRNLGFDKEWFGNGEPELDDNGYA